MLSSHCKATSSDKGLIASSLRPVVFLPHLHSLAPESFRHPPFSNSCILKHADTLKRTLLVQREIRNNSFDEEPTFRIT